MSRRTNLSKAIALLSVVLLLCLASPGSARQAKSAALQQVDLLLKGGEVHDGTGAAGRRADVGIRGDRIVFIGDAAKANVTAARTIDAKGLIVAPGFIDTHTHTGGDLSSPERKSNVNYLMQGVTTVVTGNDGGGSPEVEQTLKQWDEQGIGTNAALLVGHGAVRGAVLGRGDVQPTPEQFEKMKALVRSAMEQGAFGLSSGLYYVPGNFAKTEEVIDLAKVAAAMGGVYDTHMRDENAYSVGLLASIDESIRIGREAKIRVNISHIKCLGPEVWGQSIEAIARIRRARAEGVVVTADQYPYNASGSSLVAALLPQWAQAGTREEVLARLNDAALRPRLMEELERNLKRRGGPESLLFRSTRATGLVGKTLGAVAKERNLPPIEAAIQILREAYERGSTDGLSTVSFNMNDEDVERFMKEEFVMTGSDGSAGHPRMFGTYPRKLREYVFKRNVIPLTAMIHRSSGMPAETFRIPERGFLREGYYADVIAFDAATVADRATFENPRELAVGMKYIVVNGKLAVEDGKYTGALAGRALRKKN